MMSKYVPKKSRLSVEEVLVEFDHPGFMGSDDEFEDILY